MACERPEPDGRELKFSGAILVDREVPEEGSNC